MDDASQKQNDNTYAQPGKRVLGDKIINGNGQYAPSASSPNKEKIPAGIASENVRPSEEEIKLPEEVKNAGVVAHSDKPDLDEVHKQIGVTASAENSPVATEPSGLVSLPMTEEEAEDTLKKSTSQFHLHENMGAQAGEYTEDSLPFFAALIRKVFKEMHKKILRKK